MSDVAESIRLIIAEQSQEFLERSEAVLAVWLCLLSGQHGFFMGPAGTAKSALLSSTSSRLQGARYWHIQLDKMLDKSDSFGQYDIARFEREGVWERDFADTFGDCHIALLDEMDKAGSASLVPYLDMLTDRRFKPGKSWVTSPLVSAFAAANSGLDTSDGTLAALADRFLVRVQVNYLLEQRNFLALLASATVSDERTTRTTITMEQLEHVRLHEVAAVRLPVPVAQAILEFRTTLLSQGIICSDRRWKSSVSVLQAHAWLDGREEIIEDDLAVLRFVAWSGPEEIAVVTAAALAARSPITRALAECTGQLEDLEQELVVRLARPLDERLSWAGTALIKVDAITGRLENLGALEMRDRVGALRLSIYRGCMEGEGE